MEKLIVEYRPEWRDNFDQIREVLESTLSPIEISIEHIGSTAVPGLAAKPIIDLNIIYYKIEDLDQITKNLASIQYYHVGDQGITGREVFKRNKTDQRHPLLDSIQHHLYACHCDNDELQRHLTFRDRLRDNEHIKAKYERLKLEIAALANQDKKKYAMLKENLARDFIESIIDQPAS